MIRFLIVAIALVATVLITIPSCDAIATGWTAISRQPSSNASRDAGIPTATPIASESPAATTVPLENAAAWVTTLPRLTTAGQKVTLTGQGFASGEAVLVTVLDPTGRQIIEPLHVLTDPRGGVAETTLQLPAQLSPGEYTISGKGESSQREGNVALWVQAAPPALEVSADALRPEENLGITASGFVPGERVVFYFEGHGTEPLTALQADKDGNVRALNVPIPLLPPGEQQLIAIGSASLAQATQAFRILQFDPFVTLNANIVPPGETVSFFGSGFASRDRVEITLDGSNEVPLSVLTDDKGRLMATQAFKLPKPLSGQQTFQVRAQLTGRTLSLPFLITPSYPLVELSEYFGPPGSEVTLAARYLRPQERFEVFLGEGSKRKKLASFRADNNGWLLRDSRFRIPQDAPRGVVTLSFEGEVPRTPLHVSYMVIRQP